MRKLLNSLLLLTFCCATIKSFGQSTTLGDGNIKTSNISPLITNTNPTVSNPVASFSLVQATSNANLTQVKFTTSGTYSASTDITGFTLYVNTGANSIIGSTLVTSGAVTATGAGLQTINLSTPYALSTTIIAYYFFIVPTFGSSPVSGNTISVSSIPSTNITVSTGSVSGTAAATGTLTIINPAITGTTSASRCGAGTVSLSASAVTGDTVKWYSALSGGSSLYSGTPFITPSISSNTPYYAEASQTATIQAGTLSDNITNLVGAYEYDQRTDLHWFSTTNAVIINSVDIYPSTTGTVIITMSNSSSVILQTAPTYTVTAGQVSNTIPVTIPLGFYVPAGASNYELGGDATFSASEVLLYRGEGTAYGPYPTNINGLSQTGDALVGEAYTGYGGRCYFYNWNVSLATTAAPRSTVTATVNPVPTGVTASATPGSVCTGSNLTLTGTATGATAYSWNGPGGTAITNPASLTTASVTGVVSGNAGTYTLMTSIGTCSVTATTTAVTVNPIPSPTFTTPATSICAGNSATYTTQAGQSSYNWSVPGTSGVNYNITSGGVGSTNNSVILTWLTPGTKTVTVNYASNGCTGTTPASVTTTVNALPTPTFTPSPAASVCVNTSVSYTTQSGQSNYIWSVPGTLGTDYSIASGGIGTSSYSVTLTWLTSGTKTVTVNYANVNACTGASAASATTTVNPLPTPTFTAPPPTSICANMSVTYTTQPGESNYTWVVPGSSITDYHITSGGTGTGSNTVTLTWLTAGAKTVTVNYTNANTCTGAIAVSATTTVNALPVPSFTTFPADSVCANTSVTYATQSGQSSYVWNVPGIPTTDYTITSGGTGSASSTVTLTWLTSGAKTVTINYSNANTCAGATAASATTTVNALPVPTFTSTPGVDSICANTSVTYATQTGQLSYVWSVPGVSGTDYTITSGGTGSASSTVTLTWRTAGSKTVSVNYQNSNGCAGATAAINTTTVNALPIPTFTTSPGANICVNGSATYSTQPGQSSYAWTVTGVPGTDYTITSGGTGSTNNTVTLTWLTAGIKTLTVNYANANGCTGTSPATSAIMVNTLPDAITGPAQVCVSSSITMTDDSTGGSWSGSNPSVSVDPPSGAVTGVYADTATITYTLSTGCTASTVVTVNPLPSAISGSTSICAGTTATLSDVGGTWSSSDETVATIDSNLGIVTGLLQGPVTFTYTLPTGCMATKSFTVNPLPFDILGSTNLCTGTTITLMDGSTGGTWTSSNTPDAPINITSGTVTPLHAGTATITYTLPTGCSISTGITVNTTPAAISGNSTVCVGSTDTWTDITTGGSWSTSDFTLALVIGGAVSGVAPGTPTITYTLPTGCFVTKTVVVNPLPSIIAGANTVCMGATTPLNDTALGGTWSSSNHLYATVGSATGIVAGVNAGTVNITYTLPTGCKATTPVTVNAAAPNTGLTQVCTGANITLNNAITGGAWSSSNTSIATTDATTGTVTGIVAGAPTISYTSLDGCILTTAITVNPVPVINSVIGGGTICFGSPGVAINLSGSSAGINYQLFDSTSRVGTPMAGTGSPLNFGTHTIAGIYTVIATNPVTGCFSLMSGTAPVIVNPLPHVFTVIGGGSYCAGSTGPHIGLSGSAAGISYQLYYGVTHFGTSVTGTGAAIDFGAITLNEVYSVIATNDSTLCSDNMSGDASIVTNSLPNVYATIGGGSYCAGGTGIDVGVSASNAGINYQLYYDGSPVGPLFAGGTGAIDFGLQTPGGTYTAKAINATTGCVSDMSGEAVVVATAAVTPSVSLSPGVSDTLCSGSFALITAITTNGGPTPTYNWTVNGIARAGAGHTLSYLPHNGDIVAVTLSSSAGCLTTPTATASLGLTVFTSGVPGVTISADPGNTVCAGTPVSFTNTNVYSGAPSFTWYVNHTNVGVGASYSYTPANGDDVYVEMVSNYFCRTLDSAASNLIIIDAQTPVNPTVTISASPSNTIDHGQSVTLSATVVANGGPAPTFQWLIDGVPVPGAVSSSFTSSNFNNLDSVTCVAMSSGVCSGYPGHASITMHVSTVGVTSVSLNNGGIALIPNPNNGTFMVKGSLRSPGDAEVSLAVTNMLGQVVYNSIATALNGILNEQISLNSNLANGMYLLNVRSGDENAVFHFVIEK